MWRHELVHRPPTPSTGCCHNDSVGVSGDAMSDNATVPYCGRMPDVLRTLQRKYKKVNYYGYDIVPEAVAQNKQKFAHEPSWHIAELDLSRAVPHQVPSLLLPLTSLC